MGVWYRTGTVAVTNGSPAVVGTGTLWTSQSSVGDIFVGPDGLNYEVSSITDDTHIGIKQVSGVAAYAGATLSAQAYAIIRNFTSTLPAQLASQLAAMMTAWHVTTDELTAWLSGSGTTTVHDSVGNAYSVQTPASLNATLSGRLSKSVAGSANVTLNSVEASNLFIELTGVLTGNINVIVPASARSYFIANLTSGAFTVTVKTSAGTGVLVPQSGRVLLECDATNVIDPLTGKAAIGINGDITKLLALTSINGGQIAGNRRVGLNGDFSINQLALTSPVTLAAGVFGHDGFRGGAGGCTYSWVTVENKVTVTITAGSLLSSIDGAEIHSGVYTLGYDGTAPARWGTAAWGASGVQATLVGGTHANVEFGVGTLSLVQPEPGTVRTSYEYRKNELYLCQAHYEQALIYDAGGLGNVVTAVAITTGSLVGFRFRVEKRATASVIIYSRNGTAAKVSSVAAGADTGTSVAPNTVSARGCSLISDSGGGFAIGAGYEIFYTASARLVA